MKSYLSLLILALFTVGCQTQMSSSSKNAGETQLAHTVFFTLNDNSSSQKARLVQECQTYLKKHPGVVYFAAGTLADELQRPVNVRDFDVSLHLVFRNKSFQDAYQTAPAHQEFIKRNQTNWKQVRVFDSYLR